MPGRGVDVRALRARFPSERDEAGVKNIAVARYGGFRAKSSSSGKGFGPDCEGFVLGEKVGLLSGEELRAWSTGRLRKTLDVLEKERREIEEQIRFASSD